MTVGLSSGVAGCTGDGSHGGGTPASTDESTPTGGTTDGDGTTTIDGETTPGEVLESSVDGLSITGHEHYLAKGTDPDVHFSVLLTVENTGDQPTELSEYDFDLTAYDADGDDITPKNGQIITLAEVAPGETTEYKLQLSFRNSPDGPGQIERYGVSLACGEYSDGVYCEDGTDEETTTSNPDAVEIPTYTFSEGESYTYDATFNGNRTEETWTVTAVDGDELTVKLETTADGETESLTVSGTHGNIHDKVAQQRNINFFLVARGALVYAQKGELVAGNSFTVDTSDDEKTDWDTETVEVAGETTVNGVTCTEFSVRPEGVDQVVTACLADGYPFALSLSLSKSGQTLLEMTLTDATRP